MEIRYRNQLPLDVLALLDAIEAGVNRSINVEVNPDPPSQGNPFPDHLALRIDEDQATILVRQDGILPPKGALHELLHVQRFWIEAVPQLDLDPPWHAAAADVDNALEHLVIVPRQARYSCDDTNYWTEVMRHNWSARWPVQAKNFPQNLAVHGPLGWATTRRLVLDPVVLALGETCLTNAGLFDVAEEFYKRLAAAIDSKEEVLRIARDCFGIPQQDCWIEYISPKTGYSRSRLK